MPKLEVNLGQYGIWKERQPEVRVLVDKFLKRLEAAELDVPKVLEWAAKTCTAIVMHNAKAILVDEIYVSHPSWEADLTGELLRRFRTGFDIVGDYMVSAHVDNYAREATFLDRGTEQHFIKPVKAEALAWQAMITEVTGGPRAARPIGNIASMTKRERMGAAVSRSETQTPGMAYDRKGHWVKGLKPNDFMQRALELSMDDIHTVFGEASARLAHAINPNITSGIGMHHFPEPVDYNDLFG